ncbi:MAG: hemerythrin family protein, partial [Candidatus Omnitrophica bacterium]|nr:hemerythrin family protein [Candidatus Omnitrophota bacterium]
TDQPPAKRTSAPQPAQPTTSKGRVQSFQPNFNSETRSEIKPKSNVQLRNKIKRLEWDDKFSTGDQTIDNQHRKLFQMINQFGDDIIGGTWPQTTEKTLKFLGEYVQSHFQHEEKCMVEKKCPVAEKNVVAHKAFIDAFVGFNNRIQDEGASEEIVVELHQTATQWLVKHICGIDVHLKHCVG